MKLPAILMVSVLSLLGACVQAETAPVQGVNQPAFNNVDTNADGCIDATEFAGWGNRPSGNAAGYQMPDFADFDADQDGFISEKELGEGRAKRIAERAAQGRQMRNVAHAAPFADIDTSKDGKIDPAEFAAHQRSERQPAQP